MEWQPIKTAPKDGSFVLVCVNKHAVSAAFDLEECMWFNGLFGLEFGSDFAPTHWKPLDLPSPPDLDRKD